MRIKQMSKVSPSEIDDAKLNHSHEQGFRILGGPWR
jgi:hypothetical protein